MDIVKSDVVAKKPNPSYAEPAEDEFDDDDEEDLPDANGKNGASKDDADEDDDDDEDLDEDEFVVEKIYSHIVAEDVRSAESPKLYSMLRLGRET